MARRALHRGALVARSIRGPTWSLCAGQSRRAASVNIAETLGIVTATKVDPAKEAPAATEQDDEEFVSLVPDTCCGTVQMHTRQIVLLTPESHSMWPSRPESTKGSLAWRYSQLLRTAIKRTRAAQPAQALEDEPDAGSEVGSAAKASGGACGIGPKAEPDEVADEEDTLEPGADRQGDALQTGFGADGSAASADINPLHVKFLMADMRGAGAVDGQFEFSSNQAAYMEQRRHAIMLFPDSLLVSNLSHSDVASVVAASQAAPGQAEDRLRDLLGALGSSARVEPLAGLHFLVCAHSRRDKRCGENGVTVISWLRKWGAQRMSDVSSAAFKWRNSRLRAAAELKDGQDSTNKTALSLPLSPVPMPSPGGTAGATPGSSSYGVPSREVIHVWPVSHVGLHRMAANVLVNPPGDWFAHMHDENDARALFDHAVGLGLAAVPPDSDARHSLRRASKAELASLALRDVAWDAKLDGSGAPDLRAATNHASSLYQRTPVRRMIEPVSHWWRGRLGLTKQEQQRVFLEISPGANLDHANLSAKLMGGADRH